MTNLENALIAVRDTPHLFLDLDGTLVGSAGDVNESIWSAIAMLRGHVGLSVCTGRTRAGIAQEIAHRLDPEGLHIFENGGLVGPARGEPFHVSELPGADRLTLIETARRVGAVVEFYTTDGIFVSQLNEDCEAHARALNIHVQEADLTVIARDYAVIRAHWIMRRHHVDEVVATPLAESELAVASSPVMPDLVFGSVTRRGTSKGSAAAMVAQKVGFAMSDAVGIGDAVGDLPLLEVIGHPFVVENAPGELLQRFPALGHVDREGINPLLARLTAHRGL